LQRRQAARRDIEVRDTRRLNNFDLLRLLAAIAVLVSHSFALVGRSEPSIGGDRLGTVAVYVFFGISGFLITQSWVVSPRLWPYIGKRLLRIYPAFIVVIVVAAVILGPLVTVLPGHTYFLDYHVYGYVGRNLSMWNVDLVLPGVRFSHTAYSQIVNGSIWTLPLEMRAYLIVAVLGVIGIMRDRRVAVVVWGVVVVAASAHPSNVLGDPELLRAFAAGSALYLVTDFIPLSWIVSLVGVAVWIAVASVREARDWIAPVAIAYAAIVVAHRTPVSWRRLTRYGDFSYGIYLWAFPVQQMTVRLLPQITPLEMIGIALPVSMLFGIASWFAIERQALKLKPRPTAPLPGRAPVAVGASG